MSGAWRQLEGSGVNVCFGVSSDKSAYTCVTQPGLMSAAYACSLPGMHKDLYVLGWQLAVKLVQWAGSSRHDTVDMCWRGARAVAHTPRRKWRAVRGSTPLKYNVKIASWRCGPACVGPAVSTKTGGTEGSGHTQPVHTLHTVTAGGAFC